MISGRARVAFWRSLGLIFAVSIGVAVATLVVNEDAAAEVTPRVHLESFYDSTAPGASANVSDTFCVVNRSGYPVSQSYWQGQIAGWLNDPSGLEAASRHGRQPDGQHF